MTFAAVLPAALQAAGSIGGGLLARGGNKETKQQKMSRKVAEELVASLKGEGPYSDLFRTDEAAFQKSFVDPAKAKFRNQIAPQIQQQYIASGQQNNSGLDDQLLRAGVDLDQLLNADYMKFKQSGQDRMSNALSGVLNVGAGAPNPLSNKEAFGQSVAGYFQGDPFKELIKKYGDQAPGQQPQQQAFARQSTPKGFAPDWQDYSKWQVGDSRWGGQ